MKWFILPLFWLSISAQANTLTSYMCNTNLKTSDATTSAPCFFKAFEEANIFTLENSRPKWPHAICFAQHERVTPDTAKIAKAKASFKKNVGIFQDHEIQFVNFYFSTLPQINPGDRLTPDYGAEMAKQIKESKYVVKVQTASVKTANGEVICKTHIQFVNN